MSELYLSQVSSLEKVMPYQTDFTVIDKLSALKGERVSWQIVMRVSKDAEVAHLFFEIDSPLRDNIVIRRVENVNVGLAAYEHEHDDDFISLDSGAYPDVLYPINKNIMSARPREATVFMFTLELPKDIAAGDYDVTVNLKNEEKGLSGSTTMHIHVIDAVLPKNELVYTQWFHADCIAGYYNLEMFSPEHWDMIEKFMQIAIKTGINMLYTPLFTPPLDTRIGTERPTTQLVDVSFKDSTYNFKFDKLIKWLDLAHKCGFKRFEFSHMFTQWGAKNAPKIMGIKDGCYTRLFGWETDALSEEYQDFLHQFYPAFNEFLSSQKGEFYFHISDEPNVNNIEQYKDAYKIIKNCVTNCKIMDAISEAETYKMGMESIPVASTDSAEEILELDVPERWVYYCCARSPYVCNRFIAMPSYRNRGIAPQFFKYKVDGFLHWGFNFYNAALSDYPINPFTTTDGYGLLPSGDPFSVYPASNGPVESIRTVVFYEALQDLAAFKLLESLSSRDEVLKILEQNQTITFKTYEKSITGALKIREDVNKRIAELL